MKYQILSSCNPESLASYVNNYVLLGWKPIGGVAVSQGAFFQAVVYEIAK